MQTAYEHTKELIQKVTPTMSYRDGNFKVWQKSAKEKLAGLIGMDKFTKVDAELEIEYEKKIEGATEIRFTYKSEASYRVPCHMLLPDEVKNPPVMICLQGHSNGMHISLGRPKYEGDEKNYLRRRR